MSLAVCCAGRDRLQRAAGVEGQWCWRYCLYDCEPDQQLSEPCSHSGGAVPEQRVLRLQGPLLCCRRLRAQPSCCWGSCCGIHFAGLWHYRLRGHLRHRAGLDQRRHFLERTQTRKPASYLTFLSSNVFSQLAFVRSTPLCPCPRLPSPAEPSPSARRASCTLSAWMHPAAMSLLLAPLPCRLQLTALPFRALQRTTWLARAWAALQPTPRLLRAPSWCVPRHCLSVVTSPA